MFELRYRPIDFPLSCVWFTENHAYAVCIYLSRVCFLYLKTVLTCYSRTCSTLFIMQLRSGPYSIAPCHPSHCQHRTGVLHAVVRSVRSSNITVSTNKPSSVVCPCRLQPLLPWVSCSNLASSVFVCGILLFCFHTVPSITVLGLQPQFYGWVIM